MCLHREKISFTTSIATSQGQLSLPQTFDAIELNGRQSKVIITDYSFGAHGSVLYTTATVFFAGTIGSRDVLYLIGDTDQSHEASLILSGRGARRSSNPHVKYSAPSPSHTGVNTTTTISIRAGFEAELVTVWDSDTQLVLFSDPRTAATFWSPVIRDETANTVPGLETFWQFGTNTTALVGGPYLVRNATVTRAGSALSLYGDLNATVPLTIIGSTSVKKVTWNGKKVAVRSDGRGVLTGTLALSSKVKELHVPKLTGWKFADSLPEAKADFDDAEWVVADHSTTNISIPMAYGDGRVLYGTSSVSSQLVHCEALTRILLVRMRLWLVSVRMLLLPISY